MNQSNININISRSRGTYGSISPILKELLRGKKEFIINNQMRR